MNSRMKSGIAALLAVASVGACVTKGKVKSESQALQNCQGGSLAAVGAPSPVPKVERVFMVILENTDAEHSIQQPFMKALAQQGAYLANSHGITHPSQPNYIALTAGSLLGVDSNDDQRLDARHLGDLIEEKGKSWKTYAEGFRGGCELTSSRGPYARKHVPFLSYKNIQDNPARCARVVPSDELQKDVAQGTLADFSLFIPDNNSNGHDSGVAAADEWMEKNFGPLLKDPNFMDGTLFILTFDESGSSPTNQIATFFYGDAVRAGASSDTCYNHYNVLRTVEETLGLAHLGRNDELAAPIQDIWK